MRFFETLNEWKVVIFITMLFGGCSTAVYISTQSTKLENENLDKISPIWKEKSVEIKGTDNYNGCIYTDLGQYNKVLHDYYNVTVIKCPKSVVTTTSEHRCGKNCITKDSVIIESE